MLNQTFWKQYGEFIDLKTLEVGDIGENYDYTSKRYEIIKGGPRWAAKKIERWKDLMDSKKGN